jgi:protein required for attachment to host cells
MTKSLRTQFIVLDGSKARWVVQTEDPGHFATAKEMHAEKEARGAPQGVVFVGVSGRQSDVEEKDAALRARRDVFPATVAEAVNAEVQAGAIDRLVVVAPARTLAAVKRHLSPMAGAKLAGTLAKDLVKTPDHDLAHWLRSLALG